MYVLDAAVEHHGRLGDSSILRGVLFCWIFGGTIFTLEGVVCPLSPNKPIEFKDSLNYLEFEMNA